MVTPINDATKTGEDLVTQVILHKKLLTPAQLTTVLAQANVFKQTIFQHLLQYCFISAAEFQTACSEFFQLPIINIERKQNFDFQEKFHDAMKNHFIFPIAQNTNHVIIAICDPNDINIANKIAFQTGCSITFQFARYDIFYRLYNAYMSKQQYQQLENKNNQSPQHIAHHILSDAIHQQASDIHIEPYQDHLRIRFRIDGMLHEIIKIPHVLSDGIISCFKVLSHLDIAIKRMPQDGRLTFFTCFGFFKDCRINTCPTIHGEKMVIRLLDAHTQIREINTLGLNIKNQDVIMNAIKKPQGFVLVTGPTGSGKTITLYTLLHLLNQEHRNISTIEDPVEMQLDGINQIPVNVKTGLTFSQALRTLLRQDPDVMMIGEIRDQETAEMAIRAAQTGHLVISTMHTNSAPEAITRLLHMGIAPFHLTSALTMVIAQRLVRKLCAHCKQEKIYSKDSLIGTGIKNDVHLFSEMGCSYCMHGFSGRIGIFEVMPISDTIHQLILEQASHVHIAKQNNQNGYPTLWEEAIRAVKKGVTSLNEIYRVIPHIQ